MIMVSRRGGFSDRNAIRAENTEVQLKDFDERTRIQLENMISELYTSIFGASVYHTEDRIQKFLRFVKGEIYSLPVNTRMYEDVNQVFKIINDTINKGEYDEILTLIEAVVQYWDYYLKNKNYNTYYNEYDGYLEISLFEYVNDIFEREYIGYRFIDEIIVPISDKYEVETIDKAVQNRYKPVREHISKANVLISDRENPDYENSIKESISAVEAICSIVTESKGKDATLGKMLKKLKDNSVNIHPALEAAFSSLYGYTSDASGIRHAKFLEQGKTTFEEAKFMLVACSAFVNYIIGICAD